MTREEAIEHLKRADTTVGQTTKTRTAEALEMAIKALEQEPCEDCISRQAVLGKAIDYGSNTYLIPVNSVKALPPVTPQSKTDVLDQIRAEIEREIIPRNSDQYDSEAKWQNLGLRMALTVIDKHKAGKAESEE